MDVALTFENFYQWLAQQSGVCLDAVDYEGAQPIHDACYRMCMYVCVRICMYICVCKYIHVCMYVYIQIYI